MQSHRYQAKGKYIHVYIDHAEQQKKTTLTQSGLIAAPAFEYMQYYLQYGEILSVGSHVKNPLIVPGNKAIFHHLIEEEDRYELHRFENGDQIRFVDTETETTALKMYGIIDKEGNVFPCEPFVFGDPEPDEIPQEAFEEIDALPGMPNYRAAITKKGDLYVPLTGDPTRTKNFFRSKVIATTPDEQEFKDDDIIVVQDFGKYPIQLPGGPEIWACNKLFIVATIDQ